MYIKRLLVKYSNILSIIAISGILLGVGATPGKAMDWESEQTPTNPTPTHLKDSATTVCQFCMLDGALPKYKVHFMCRLVYIEDPGFYFDISPQMCEEDNSACSLEPSQNEKNQLPIITKTTTDKEKQETEKNESSPCKKKTHMTPEIKKTMNSLSKSGLTCEEIGTLLGYEKTIVYQYADTGERKKALTYGSLLSMYNAKKRGRSLTRISTDFEYPLARVKYYLNNLPQNIDNMIINGDIFIVRNIREIIEKLSQEKKKALIEELLKEN